MCNIHFKFLRFIGCHEFWHKKCGSLMKQRDRDKILFSNVRKAHQKCSQWYEIHVKKSLKYEQQRKWRCWSIYLICKDSSTTNSCSAGGTITLLRDHELSYENNPSVRPKIHIQVKKMIPSARYTYSSLIVTKFLVKNPLY